MEQIKVKILYFAKIKEIMKKGVDEIQISNSNTTIKGKEVFELVINKNTNLSHELKPVFDTCLISLNDEYVDRDEEITLKSGDELSILPPISAG